MEDQHALALDDQKTLKMEDRQAVRLTIRSMAPKMEDQQAPAIDDQKHVAQDRESASANVQRSETWRRRWRTSRCRRPTMKSTAPKMGISSGCRSTRSAAAKMEDQQAPTSDDQTPKMWDQQGLTRDDQKCCLEYRGHAPSLDAPRSETWRRRWWTSRRRRRHTAPHTIQPHL